MTEQEDKVLEIIESYCESMTIYADQFEDIAKEIVQSLALPLVIDSEKTDWLQAKIDNAKNCLVCCAIADPLEVIENTLEILDHE